MDSKAEEGASSAFEEAAGWYARLAADDAGPADHAAFAAWHAVPSNAAAWAELRRLDAALAGPARAAHATLGPTAGLALGRVRRRVLVGSGAAALAGAGALLLPSRIDRLSSDVATAVGERRRIDLPGGASVLLNTDSALDLGPGPLDLRRGEALLTVPRRATPLRAVAGAASVEAQDASFGLRRDGDVTRVTVLDGVARAGIDGRMMPVTADRQATLSEGRGIAVLPVVADHVLAWRRGQLVLAQAPLGEVVAEIRRYRGGLVLLDPRIADRRVTAILDLDRLDDAIDTLARSLGLLVTRLTPLLLALRAPL